MVEPSRAPAPASDPAAPPRRMRWWPFLLSYPAFIVFWMAGLGIGLLHAAHSRRAGLKAGLLCLVIGPQLGIPILFFGLGAIGYARGTACLMASSLPGPEFHNVHPEYRCGRVSMGCVVDGSELFTQLPNNLAVTLLSAALGPMLGTYHGPYPTRDEAFAALERARARSSRAEILAGPQRIGLPNATDRQALEQSLQHLHRSEDLACATLQDATVLVGAARDGVLPGRVLLFDRATGERYALYQEHAMDVRTRAAGAEEKPR